MADAQHQHKHKDQSTGRTRRACDGCRTRRVKCSGNPIRCQQCSHLNLNCVYSTAAPNASRSGIARGSVISRLKKDRVATATCNIAPRGDQPVAASQVNHRRTGSVGPTPARTPDEACGTPTRFIGGELEEPTSPAASHHGAFSKDFFTGLISDYTLYVYDVNPIISPLEILQSIDNMDEPGHLVDNALVHAYAAVTLNLTIPNWQADSSMSARIHQLLGLALEARSTVKTRFMSTVRSSIHPHLTACFVMSAIFAEMCLMAEDKFSEAFIILREAIAMIQLMGVDRLVAEEHEATRAEPGQGFSVGAHPVPAERSRRIRLYWEAFIHERFLTIVAYYPPALPLLPAEVSLPIHDPTVPRNVHMGWQYLIKLFSVLDDEFVQYWLSSNTPTSKQVTAEWIETKMQYLDDLYQIDLEMHHDLGPQHIQCSPASASSPFSDRDSAAAQCLTTLQKADIIITRQWLLMLLWQLAISNFLLTSESISTRSTAMSLQFPVRLSQQLRQVLVSLGRKSIERHGSGILKKLFEITNALADVSVHVPTDDDGQVAQRLNDFRFLFDFLHTSGSLNEVQAAILAEKYAAISGRAKTSSAQA